ncbi:hypothetical protein ABW19_dt0210399 [Dactylella cylindrospora]|nr:hypothetical protein ABW19_dt0210399 [Dactylella cylindrospora]
MQHQTRDITVRRQWQEKPLSARRFGAAISLSSNTGMLEASSHNCFSIQNATATRSQAPAGAITDFGTENATLHVAGSRTIYLRCFRIGPHGILPESRYQHQR